MPDIRTETDSFGSIEVPGHALWGAQTERSRRFFAIGEQHMPLPVVHALAEVKRAAAEVNRELGLLDATKADAIAAAAARAGLEDYKVDYVSMPLSPRELLLQQLADRVGSVRLWTPSAVTASLEALLAPVADAAAELASLKDPRHIYARCLACGAIR